MMKCGTEVIIHLVSVYIDVKGNKVENEAAKEVTERTCTRGYPEQFALLAHVDRTITERKWKEARH